MSRSLTPTPAAGSSRCAAAPWASTARHERVAELRTPLGHLPWARRHERRQVREVLVGHRSLRAFRLRGRGRVGRDLPAGPRRRSGRGSSSSIQPSSWLSRRRHRAAVASPAAASVADTARAIWARFHVHVRIIPRTPPPGTPVGEPPLPGEREGLVQLLAAEEHGGRTGAVRWGSLRPSRGRPGGPVLRSSQVTDRTCDQRTRLVVSSGLRITASLSVSVIPLRRTSWSTPEDAGGVDQQQLPRERVVREEEQEQRASTPTCRRSRAARPPSAGRAPPWARSSRAWSPPGSADYPLSLTFVPWRRHDRSVSALRHDHQGLVVVAPAPRPASAVGVGGLLLMDQVQRGLRVEPLGPQDEVGRVRGASGTARSRASRRRSPGRRRRGRSGATVR